MDRALDLAVVPGYTKIGYALRRPGFDALPRMEGRTVLVTGATSGLGRAAATRFAALGARVVVLARDEGRGKRVLDEIRAHTGNEDLALVLGDLSSLSSTREAAERIIETELELDVLVNNAGVMRAEREESVDGLELTFATNVAGTFLITQTLLPLLVSSAPARIITVSSGGMYTQRLDVDDLQTERRAYDGPSVYARTKRAQVILTHLWARRLADTGVVAHSMHPGWANTPGVTESLPRFDKVMGPLLRSPEQGADTIVWLGAAEEPAETSGGFWHDRRERPEYLVPGTREAAAEREALWEALVQLTSPVAVA